MFYDNLWTVCANVVKTDPRTGWQMSVQIPMFYLAGNMQGIQNEEHALAVATDIINPLRDPNVVVHAHVVRHS